MINILIANDTKDVLKKIKKYVKTLEGSYKIYEAKSYQETLKILDEINIDKLILDITMYTYEIALHEDGGSLRRNAGVDILNRLKLYNIDVEVLLVTQLQLFYDSVDSKKYDFNSIKAMIDKGYWLNCKKIIRFGDELNLDWQNEIKDFLGEI